MDFNAPERRKFRRKGREYSRAMLLGNGQVITTVPRELTRMYKIGKGSLFKWTEAGPGRILIELQA
jgi:hypothetical protein